MVVLRSPLIPLDIFDHLYHASHFYNRFDRVLSIEMFEHMKKYSSLLHKISTWLKPKKEAKGGEALLFVHIFCHKDSPYDFELDDGWVNGYPSS